MWGCLRYREFIFINTSMKSFKEVERIDLVCEGMYQDLEITEAEYQGKKVKLNEQYEAVVRSSMFMSKMETKSKKFLSVTQLVYQLSVMILLDVNRFVQDITVIIQDRKQRQDIGLVINGVRALRSITNKYTM